MTRGFTLIEMQISMVMLIVLFTIAIPSFSQINEKNRMRRLAQAIQGVFIQTHSEVILKNQTLYLHFIRENQSLNQTWALVVTADSIVPVSLAYAKNQALIYLEGVDFVGVQLNSTNPILAFDAINGKPQLSGNISFSIKPNKRLKFKYFRITGRTVICGIGGSFYGYQDCSV